MLDNTDSSPDTLSAASIARTTQGLPKMEKIIVAIHGIGSQLRNDTIRSVAHQFGNLNSPPLSVMPLGFFNLGKTADVRISRLDTEDEDLAKIGFAEIFWADIPEQVVKANDTLEETKAWGRTVVSRAQAMYRKKIPEGEGQLSEQDFELGVGVIEEIIETIDVMENLLAVTAKMGLFKFELAPLLRDYVGDVQLVTDFPFYREKILYRFHNALAQIVNTFGVLYPGHAPEIYIVAHSEGTVISFLGMLQALSGSVVSDPDSTLPSPVPIDTGWIKHVQGYMTIGSPIDKHIALWPKLWQGMQLESRIDPEEHCIVFEQAARKPLTLSRQIQWRNYYDLGDPIGFQLDAAVDFLKKNKCKAFEFSKKHDFGFSRYWFPGKAHNDYWQDGKVFGHFIEDVVLRTNNANPPPEPPQSIRGRDKFSLLIPYLLTFLLHFAAVFVLYKGVTLAPSTQAITPLLAQTTQSKALHELFAPLLQVGLISLLLLSITIAARLPRLVKSDVKRRGDNVIAYIVAYSRWRLAALLTFLFGAGCVLALPIESADFLGGPFAMLVSWGIPAAYASKAALLIVAFAMVMSGWLAPRTPKAGRWWLLGFGVAVIVFILISHFHMPIWPVVLAGLAFLYLWWLGILLFDLTFIWHRYIRRSVAVDALFQWRRGRDAKPDPKFGLGRAQPYTRPQNLNGGKNAK